MTYPSSTGPQRVLFTSDGYDGYDTRAAGPDPYPCVALLARCFLPASCRAGEADYPPLRLFLVAYPSSIGALRVLFASDGHASYAVHAAGPAFTCGAGPYFWSRARPEIVYLAPLRPFSCAEAREDGF